MNVQFFLALVIAVGFVAGLEAKCCKRKGPICCGNGKCDALCCNCDGGCNAHCELADVNGCSPLQWLECAGIVAACAVACADPEDPLCRECLGPMYDVCVGCLSLDVDRQRALDDTKYMLDAYHKKILPYNIYLGEILKRAEEKSTKKKKTNFK
ncbi:Hypothetical predicted protein [Paramuricea clavata]|uniref:Uncharacterized protein n=1 Tax=Paramuricea clavata TaxID=317549 RepID=A0A6S7GF69_PARCT|nr:Hypothetical predicted protein [Paramuricea clavata]